MSNLNFAKLQLSEKEHASQKSAPGGYGYIRFLQADIRITV
jgi:hypothetical protein